MHSPYPKDRWPQGYVTFLSTDIKNSPLIATQDRDSNHQFIYDVHISVFQAAVEENNGCIFNNIDDGFVAVFPSPDDAVHAAETFQMNLLAALLSTPTQQLQPRVGIHRAESLVEPYLLPDTIHAGFFVAEPYGTIEISRSFRVMTVAEPGQILLSPSAKAGLITCALPFIVWEGRFLESLAVLWDLHEAIYKGWSSVEPGSRLFPSWYTHEKNRYISRPALESRLIENFRRKRNDTAFMLTLRGGGGIGKTRLAIHVGVRVSGFFKDHVYFVSLSLVGRGPRLAKQMAESVESPSVSISEDELLRALAYEIGEVLKLPENQRAPDTVAAALLSKHMLLILDNFESVSCVAVSTWLSGLVGRARDLYVLLTSRGRAGIVGMGETLDLDQGMEPAEARELFLSRMAQAQGTSPHGTSMLLHEPSIEAILKQTEGVPLLIEYAAAWVAEVGLKSIARGLKEALSEFTGVPDGHAFHDDETEANRHHTYVCTLNWSYNLLGQRHGIIAQKVFAVSGLMMDEFTAATLTTLINEYGTQKHLSALVNVALLQRRQTEDGEMRYRLHHRTKAYALALLDQRDDAADVLKSYVDHFLNLAVTEGPKVDRGELNNLSVIRQAMIALTENVADIESALEKTAKTNPERAAQVTSTMKSYIIGSARLFSARTLRVTLDCALQGGYRLLAARCIEIQAGLSFRTGQDEEATRLYNQALPIFKKERHPIGEGNCLLHLGHLALRAKNYKKALQFYDQASLIYKKALDRLGEANCLQSLGDVATQKQQYPQAAKFYNQAIVIFGQEDEPVGQANCLRSLGFIEGEDGNKKAAREYIKRALDIETRISHLHNQGISWFYLMQLADDETEREYCREKARAVWMACGAIHFLSNLQ